MNFKTESISVAWDPNRYGVVFMSGIVHQLSSVQQRGDRRGNLQILNFVAMARLNAVVSVLLSLCLLASFVGGKSTKVTYCDKKGNYDVKVGGVEITPYPVARGKPATFSISATASEAITGGKVVIDVSYYGIHVHTEIHDLCSETSCPISSGDFVLAHSQVLPGFTPPGSYTLTMKMIDGNRHQLTCIGFPFSIGFGSESDVASM